MVDGVFLGPEQTAAPYSMAWNTVNAGNGSHVVTAMARDASGNVTTSAPVTVTVANTDLRLIDWLNVQVNPDTACMVRRRPISVEACP